MSNNPKMSSSENFENLNYVFMRQELASSGLYFNLGPRDSDFGPHETILSNLVGTLVKVSESGEIRPYLAESFRRSLDGLTWIFKIRPGLICQDGSTISAESFAQRITFSLREYSKKSKVIDFELIEGWDDFYSGKVSFLSGISFSDNELAFQLVANPENFIGHLRLPYFGYWCESNFDNDGAFKDEQQIISSGAYRVVSSEKNELVLEARKDWFSWNTRMATHISYKYMTRDNIKDLSEPAIIEMQGRDKNVPNLPSYHELKSSPSLMWSMVVSPFKNGPFQDIHNRRVFADKIEIEKRKHNLFKADFFFPSAPSSVDKSIEIGCYSKEMNGYHLKFAFANRNYTQEEMSEIKKIVTDALSGSDSTVEFFIDDPVVNQWRHRLLSNQEFDIRMNGVDQGGYPQNRTIKMMFCSNLGVCFPDPSGRIRKIVSAHDKAGGTIQKEYVQEFNQALYDDAVVIPLTHFGSYWRVSEDIDLSTLSTKAGIFHFEGIWPGPEKVDTQLCGG